MLQAFLCMTQRVDRYTIQLVKKAILLNIGWWFQPPLKNISQLGLLFPIYVKIKHVPNHQSGSYTFEKQLSMIHQPDFFGQFGPWLPRCSPL